LGLYGFGVTWSSLYGTSNLIQEPGKIPEPRSRESNRLTGATLRGGAFDSQSLHLCLAVIAAR